MKPIQYRTCAICGEDKRTTNIESPFVCETPCLRVDARNLILNTKTGSKLFWRGLIISVIILIIGILIGSYF